MSVKLVTLLLLQTAIAVLAGVRPFNEIFRQPPRLDGRIVGGQPINITDAPYQIFLITPEIYCGAVLISKEWILTAAHCTWEVEANSILVLLGTTKISQNMQLQKIKKKVEHEKYNYPRPDYDFSLLQLQEPIEFDETKQAVKLPRQGQDFKDGEMCFVSGWGETRNSNESEEWLRQVKVPLFNQEECNKIYGQFIAVTDSMICAGYSEGGKDSCTGDSGGPLVNGNGVLVGVVSWGKGCALPNYPGVYGRVSYVREWIRKHSGV